MGSTDEAERDRAEGDSTDERSTDERSTDERSTDGGAEDDGGRTDREDRGSDDTDSSSEKSEDELLSGGPENADPAAMEAKYEPGKRPTVVMPGTRGAVSGTAFADQVDDQDEAVKNPAVHDPWIASEHEDDEDQQPSGGEDGGTENIETASGDADKSHAEESAPDDESEKD